MNRLDRLQEEAEKLVSLLKGREPGLSTWWGFFEARCEALRELLKPMKHLHPAGLLEDQGFVHPPRGAFAAVKAYNDFMGQEFGFESEHGDITEHCAMMTAIGAFIKAEPELTLRFLKAQQHGASPEQITHRQMSHTHA